MSLIGRDDDAKDPEEVRDEEHKRQKDTAAAKAALHDQRDQSLSLNPGFLAQLQDFDLDGSEHPVTQILGPLDSGAAILGNREEAYENQQRWLNQNRAERMVTEGNPGRLCRGRLRQLAWHVHERDEKDPPALRSPDEKRAIRDAMERITNVESLSKDARLLRALTESVAVTRTEESGDSTTEKASRLIGGRG
jgi:hypothetical protein